MHFYSAAREALSLIPLIAYCGEQCGFGGAQPASSRLVVSNQTLLRRGHPPPELTLNPENPRGPTNLAACSRGQMVGTDACRPSPHNVLCQHVFRPKQWWALAKGPNPVRSTARFQSAKDQ